MLVVLFEALLSLSKLLPNKDVLMQCVLDFLGLRDASILKYETLCPTVIVKLLMVNIILIPVGIYVPAPCASQPSSLAKMWFQMRLFSPHMMCL